MMEMMDMEFVQPPAKTGKTNLIFKTGNAPKKNGDAPYFTPKTSGIFEIDELMSRKRPEEKTFATLGITVDISKIKDFEQRKENIVSGFSKYIGKGGIENNLPKLIEENIESGQNAGKAGWHYCLKELANEIWSTDLQKSKEPLEWYSHVLPFMLELYWDRPAKMGARMVGEQAKTLAEAEFGKRPSLPAQVKLEEKPLEPAAKEIPVPLVKKNDEIKPLIARQIAPKPAIDKEPATPPIADEGQKKAEETKFKSRNSLEIAEKIIQNFENYEKRKNAGLGEEMEEKKKIGVYLEKIKLRRRPNPRYAIKSLKNAGRKKMVFFSTLGMEYDVSKIRDYEIRAKRIVDGIENEVGGRENLEKNLYLLGQQRLKKEAKEMREKLGRVPKHFYYTLRDMAEEIYGHPCKWYEEALPLGFELMGYGKEEAIALASKANEKYKEKYFPTCGKNATEKRVIFEKFAGYAKSPEHMVKQENILDFSKKKVREDAKGVDGHFLHAARSEFNKEAKSPDAWFGKEGMLYWLIEGASKLEGKGFEGLAGNEIRMMEIVNKIDDASKKSVAGHHSETMREKYALKKQKASA